MLNARAGSHDHRADRFPIAHDASSAAGERSAPAPPGYFARAGTVGLGAAHSAEGWIDPDDFLLRKTVERERGACSADRQRGRLMADMSARQNDLSRNRLLPGSRNLLAK